MNWTCHGPPRDYGVKKKKAEVSDDSFTDVRTACVKPRDAEVRAAAVEDIHPRHVIYNWQVLALVK